MYIRINRNSLGQFKKRRETLVYESAPIGYKDNPKFNPDLPEDSFNVRQIPFVHRGMTFNEGRNKAKRVKREMRRTTARLLELAARAA